MALDIGIPYAGEMAMNVYAMLKKPVQGPVRRSSVGRTIAPTLAGMGGQVRVRQALRGPVIQSKLIIGAPDDKYEREADRGMAMPEPRVQRETTDEDLEEEGEQTKPLGATITPLVQRDAEKVEEEEGFQAKLLPPFGSPLVQRLEEIESHLGSGLVPCIRIEYTSRMARPLRIEFAGALYHVTSRGDGREPIYLMDTDRDVWLEILGQVCERFCWVVHAYCQMGNHYHLLVETPDGNLATGMRQLNGVYTQRFNQRHNRVGHVFQGRYKAILVQRETYLLELSRYIVLNPVRAGMVRTAQDWPWSNYRATAGMTSAPGWLETDWLLAAFAERLQEAQSAYRRFVADGRNQPSPWENLKNQIYLGSEAFVDEMQRKVTGNRRSSEIPRTQRRAAVRPLAWYFNEQEDRDRAVLAAFRSGGYSMREIGEHIGLHYATISRIISAAEKRRNEA
jgi:REP element-mobilizing transposase RayT